MRLSITLPELESGSAVIQGRKERRLDIARDCRTREPFACSPVRTHDGKTVAVIMPTGDVEEQVRGIEIKFRPVWVKTFLVCAMRKDTLTRIICEFDFGKYMIDAVGVHEANLTTGGSGTDPDAVRDSELVLGRLIDTPQRPDVLYQLIGLLKRSF